MEQLAVDPKKKKLAHRRLMRSLTPVIILRCAAWLILIGGVGWGAVRIIREGVPFKWTNLTITCIVIGISLLLALLLHVAAREVAGYYAGNRMEERLFIKQGELRYIYRLRHFGNQNGRFVAVIPLQFLDRIVWEEKTGRLLFYGKVMSGYTERVSAAEETPSQAVLDKYVICDYFQPPLTETIQHLGVMIMKR